MEIVTLSACVEIIVREVKISIYLTIIQAGTHFLFLGS